MTMKELAAIAGVSSSAVSRYLNGGSLSKEKRERIAAAIEQTGYQPDAVAQMLRTGMSDNVALIVPKLDSDAVSRVARGASQTLAAAGYLTVLADTANDPEQEVAYMTLFQNRQVAGIILMATYLTPQHENIINNSSVPIVVVGQQFAGMSCIYHDDEGAAYELTQRLLNQGRSHLALIGVTELDIAVGQNRRLGTERAMKEAGLDKSTLKRVTSDFTVEGGRSGMKELLEQEGPIDGLICATDRIAIGAIEILKQQGLRVPEDVSVVSFDDNWAGEYVSPSLTTAHFYYKESGEQAASLLLDQIKDQRENTPVIQTMLGYRIVDRDSVG